MRTGSRRNVCAIALPGDAGRRQPFADRLLDRGVLGACRPRGPDGLVRRRHRLGLLQQSRHALALTRDLHQRLPDRLPPGERGERPLHQVAVLRGRVVAAPCPPSGSTSATHPRVSIGWFE